MTTNPTPNHRPAHVSFHQWIALQKHSAFRDLAEVWEPCRGRMTEASVERRATLTYGLPPLVGESAFRAYKYAIAVNNL